MRTWHRFCPPPLLFTIILQCQYGTATPVIQHALACLFGTPPAYIQAMKRKNTPVKAVLQQTGARMADAGASIDTGAPRSSSFGPAVHNAWALDGQGVSLVRKPLAPKVVRFGAQPQPIEIDIARSAVIVIDMQNDFCHPEGWFAQKGLGVKATRKPIPVLQRFLPTWRAAGGVVVWLNWGIRADRLNLSPTIQFKGKRSADGVGYAESSPLDRGPSLVRDSWGAQVVEELPVSPSDITVLKHRLSGFWDNELDTVLRQQGITTLLFTGVNTDRCVFSTLQDAGFLGYDCVLLSDACSTGSPAYVSRAIHFIVQQLHGFVATVEALLTSLAEAPRPKRSSPAKAAKASQAS
ncbi:isochorismatase family cysteine hydrolase [Xylophilus sp. GOD-11R]|uniref:cysteine hydrolase family protein n=1 Tax=Xylophilus sp. GOD-11R TaxID=3089814 RepID=UPI00298CADB6|nr:isochorismatase family cysteine hydrolase [Xylophilus sp. GOD-11R]WPB57154.1 isochorismatase family cysteine hydrolase [Xylophilus sp. GOD-11R]